MISNAHPPPPSTPVTHPATPVAVVDPTKNPRPAEHRYYNVVTAVAFSQIVLGAFLLPFPECSEYVYNEMSFLSTKLFSNSVSKFLSGKVCLKVCVFCLQRGPSVGQFIPPHPLPPFWILSHCPILIISRNWFLYGTGLSSVLKIFFFNFSILLLFYFSLGVQYSIVR